MRVPSFDPLRPPSRRIRDGRGCTSRDDVKARLQKRLDSSDEDAGEFLPSGGQRRCGNRPGWARRHLSKAGFIDTGTCGEYELTTAGRELLMTTSPTLVIDDLEKCPVVQAREAVSRAFSNDAASTTATLVVPTYRPSSAAFPG